MLTSAGSGIRTTVSLNSQLPTRSLDNDNQTVSKSSTTLVSTYHAGAEVFYLVRLCRAAAFGLSNPETPHPPQ